MARRFAIAFVGLTLVLASLSGCGDAARDEVAMEPPAREAKSPRMAEGGTEDPDSAPDIAHRE